jgi:hypothetical protein
MGRLFHRVGAGVAEARQNIIAAVDQKGRGFRTRMGQGKSRDIHPGPTSEVFSPIGRLRSSYFLSCGSLPAVPKFGQVS